MDVSSGEPTTALDQRRGFSESDLPYDHSSASWRLDWGPVEAGVQAGEDGDLE